MNGVIEAEQWKAMIAAAAGAVEQEREHLTQLDSTVGDGDHGANMARALRTAAGEVQTLSDVGPAAILRQVGLSLQSEIGGAAGAIFGGFFQGMASALGAATSNDGATDATALVAALKAGLAEVQKRGRAQAGGKTVVDALAPAVAAASDVADREGDVAVALRRAATAAEEGAAATREMVARYGRARFLGERSRGYQDAGATSMAIMLQAMADVMQASDD